MAHDSGSPRWLLGLPLVLAGLVYLVACTAVRRRGRWWPTWRACCWVAGLAAAGLALAGATEDHYVVHMAGHLLLGMVAPLLLVAGAPVTLALRALPVRRARLLSRLLSHRPVCVLTHPVTAAFLDAGGLWILYTTGLYPAMTQHHWLHPIVALHVLVSGCLLTAAIIGVDPAPHRPGRPARAVVLVAFLAAHAVLAKFLYGHPPAGVSVAQAQTGAQVMYYGGDLVELAMIVVFCRQWYVATDPRRSPRAAVPSYGTRRPWRLADDLRAGVSPAAGGALIISSLPGEQQRATEVEKRVPARFTK